MEKEIGTRPQFLFNPSSPNPQLATCNPFNLVIFQDLIPSLLAKEKEVSVFGIGPAGENGVLYSAIVGDRGHLGAHNGLGAVMGSKNLKAVVTYRGKRNFKIKDPDRPKEKNEALFEHAKKYGVRHK